jgi:HEAT repeat protein
VPEEVIVPELPPEEPPKEVVAEETPAEPEEVIVPELPPEKPLEEVGEEAAAEELPEEMVEEVVVEEPELEPIEEAAVEKAAVEEVKVVPSEEEEEARRLIEAREWKKVLEIGEPAVGPLIQALKEGDQSKRKKAGWILGEIGEPAVEPLLAALEEPETRETASQVLQKLGWETGDAAQKAQRLIAEGQWDDVAKMGGPAVGPSIKALEDEDDEVRRSAAAVLGTIGDEIAVAPLVKSLQDDDSEVRRRAARSLGIIRSDKAVEPLVLTLEDDDMDVRSRAAASLERLRWEPGDDRERAIYLIAKKQWYKLAEIGEAATGPLSSRLEDKDEEVRNEASWLLEEIGSAEDLDKLFHDLKDK